VAHCYYAGSEKPGGTCTVLLSKVDAKLCKLKIVNKIRGIRVCLLPNYLFLLVSFERLIPTFLSSPEAWPPLSCPLTKLVPPLIQVPSKSFSPPPLFNPRLHLCYVIHSFGCDILLISNTFSRLGHTVNIIPSLGCDILLIYRQILIWWIIVGLQSLDEQFFSYIMSELDLGSSPGRSFQRL